MESHDQQTFNKRLLHRRPCARGNVGETVEKQHWSQTEQGLNPGSTTCCDKQDASSLEAQLSATVIILTSKDLYKDLKIKAYKPSTQCWH